MELPDGLYQVNTPHMCAGFEVKDGRVIHCAPILRRRFDYWMRFAKRISYEHKNQEERETWK